MNRPDRQSEEQKTTVHVKRLWTTLAAGDHTELDRILAENPSQYADPEKLADLVYSEFWLRKQIDTTVTESEYLTRFPEIADLLRDQFLVAEELFGNSVAQPSFQVGQYSSINATDASLESMVPIGFDPISILGIGGMGVIIQARQRSLNRDVAIKSLKAGNWITEADRTRFRNEAKIVGQLKHPNIVQIYDVIEQDGKLFLILEHVPGKSLTQVISNSPTDTKFAVSTIQSVASAIKAAHGAGFLHLDIKPSNVLQSSSGEIKVTDFGLAKATDASTLSMSGEFLGTLAYVAPEQITGRKSEVDARTDVYGIGATLYELLTGRPPFIGSSPAETLMQVAHATEKSVREINPNVPRDLESICHRCLSKSPSNRYASAADLLDDIERFNSGRPTLARPVSLAEKAKRWVLSHPSQAISIAAVCLAQLILVITSTWYFTKLASLEAVGQSREVALSEAKKRSQSDSYYAVISSIQAAVSERRVGWTWEAKDSIQLAIRSSPSADERLNLRNALCKTLHGFDLRHNSIALAEIDPFGFSWAADGSRLAIGHNISKRLEDGGEIQVVSVLGDWPERKIAEIQFPIPDPAFTASDAVEGIRSLAFLNDNRSLAVGCRSGWVQVVDVESGKILTQWKAHNDWCYAMHFDPKRDWLVTGCRDGSVQIWDIHTHASVQQLSATGSVSSIGIIDGQVVTMGQSFERFQIPSYDRVSETRKQPHNYSNMLPLIDLNSLVVASNQKIVSFSNSFGESKEFNLRRSPFTKSDYIRHMDRSAKSEFYSVSSNENVVFLDGIGMTELLSLPNPGMGNKYVTFDRKGECLWITNNYQLVRYDWARPKEWSSIRFAKSSHRTAPVSEAKLSPIASSKGFSVNAYPFVNGEAIPKWTRILIDNVSPHETLLESLCNSIVGKEGNLVSVEWPSLTSTGIWDATANQLRLSGLSINEDTTIEETAFCLSRDGVHYWTADKTKSGESGESVGRLRVLRVADGKLLLEWENLESERKLRLSRIEHIVCGKRLTLTVSVDRHLRVYDSTNFQMLNDIDLGAGKTLKRVALDAPEARAFVGTQEGEVFSVDLLSGNFQLLLSNNAEITALATSIEGILALGDPEGSIKLWSIPPRDPAYLCSLVTLPNSILALEFSGDNKKLAVQVDGELGVRVLDWPAFKSRLKEFDLLWSQ